MVWLRELWRTHLLICCIAFVFKGAGGAPQLNPVILNQVVDPDGVPRHIGRIADSMTEWEGAISENLGLTPADVESIKTKHPFKLHLQA